MSLLFLNKMTSFKPIFIYAIRVTTYGKHHPDKEFSFNITLTSTLEFIVELLEQSMLFTFNKAFDTVSHNTLIGKLRKCGLDGRTMRWIENRLNGRTQRAVISRPEFSWRPVTSGVPQGSCQYWAQSCSTYSSMSWMKS